MSKGKVSRGWLGVSIQSVDESIAEKYGLDKPKGALVNEVLKDSPAEAAKIQKGDIIVEFNGKPIADAADLRSLVGMTEPGKQVKLKVIREKAEKVIEVKIAERSDSEPRVGARSGEDLKGITVQEDWQGIIVQELTPELAKRFGYEGQEGVLIAEVKPNSPASKAGLQRGDLILELEKQPVKNLDDYKAAIKNVKSPTLLYIKRGGNALFVTISY
jgi:serine protease Do